jgi:hypothetical protein
MDLQVLFDEPIVRTTYLDPGYSGHASDVWLVETEREKAIVRAFRWDGPGGPFWGGLHHLFALDPREVFALEPLNRRITQLSPVPAPLVLRKQVVDGRQTVVVQHMPGTVVTSFRKQPATLLEDLGRSLASLHAHHFDWYGNPTGQARYPLSSFPRRLAETMRMLVETIYMDEPAIVAALDPMYAAALHMAPPEAAVLVMPDLDASQFLWDGGRLTAVVDTEAYVVGPRELDFIALEYVLDGEGAAAFMRAYSELLPLPPLETVRPLLRYFLRLLEVQDPVDLDTWMAWPRCFDEPAKPSVLQSAP